MKQRNPRKELRRAGTLFCACLLAVLLLRQTPNYAGAQTVQRVAVKKGAGENTASSPPPDGSGGKKDKADSDSGSKKEGEKKEGADSKAEKKDAPEGVETKTAVAADDPPAKDGDGAEKDKSKGKDKTAKEEKLNSTDEIQLSFQGAQVDMIVQWLAQQTGKSVIKHPRVQCQLTIVGSKKIQRREAINLVYRALSLEGFVAIESSKAILIVPEGQEPKMSPEMLSGSKNDIPEGRQKLVKIFPLSHAQAGELKEKVKALLSEKGAIDTDDRANQIIVTDYNENIGLIGDMIRALDSDRPQDVAVRVIPLKNVSAQDLVKEIGPLYQKLTAKSPTKETVEVAANDRSNSLMVLSSEANFKAIEAMVAGLDTEDAQEKVMRAFPLKNAEAQDVAKQLQDLYQEQDTNNRYPYYYFGGGGNQQKPKKLNVVADRRRNTLIVQAPPASMENIQKMIEALDEPVGDETLAPRIYPLKYVSAPDIEDILNELFLKKSPARNYWDPWSGMPEPQNVDRDVGRLYGKVRITSEPYSNALIITANSKENLEAVEAILKQLDVPSQAGETTLRVGLNFAKSATVANSMNVLFARSGAPAYGRGGQQQQQQPNQGQPQQQQQQNQTSSYEANFTLEQESKEEAYFPWLGGQQENQRTADGRNVSRQVSDLVGKVRVVPDSRSNSLLISANTHFFPQILKLIEELDAPTAQVLIEAKILEVASDFLDKLGVRWSPDGSKVFTPDDFDNSILLNTKGAFVKGFGGGAGGAAASAIANGLQNGAIQGTFNLDFLIQFLKKTTDASVLAEPQINIEDNQTGRIFVGQQVPVLDSSITPSVGGLTQGFHYKDVGVILEVTPHINTSGDVSLRIHAESSAVVPGVTGVGGANFFDTRNFKTDLEAKDGQILVLGGIIQRQIADILRKTPILGDIPGLGWFFKKQDKTTREVELMVFLRPKVVRTPEQAKELMQEIEKKTPLIKQWEEDFHKGKDQKLKEEKSKQQSSKGKDGVLE